MNMQKRHRSQVDLMRLIMSGACCNLDGILDDLNSKKKRKRPGSIHSRRAKHKKDFDQTRWMGLLNNPLTRRPDSFFGKMFRNRFRVPYRLFMKVHDIFVDRDWLQGKEYDAFMRPTIPFKLKLLCAFRFIGRGECFDTIQELTGDRVSREVIRKFIISWARKMSELKSEYIKVPNPDNAKEVRNATMMYASLGFPGCIGSTDCVNIPLGRCPYSMKNVYTGKDGHPTMGFNCTVNHHRRFLHVSSGCPGSFNDKAKVRFDEFVLNVRDGMYKDYDFWLRNNEGEWEVLHGVYLIVDGGYHRWSVLQCPLKQSSSAQECLHSRWLESVRKDVECVFGILKTRFRCLKLPSRFHDLQILEDLFVTCAILHNMLLDDELEQREKELSGDFAEKEDFIHWIRRSRRYKSEFVSYMFKRVLRRSVAVTDLSSTGDNGTERVEEYDEDEEDGDCEHLLWSQLHARLVTHFYQQWKRKKLLWNGFRQPIRVDNVIRLISKVSI